MIQAAIRANKTSLALSILAELKVKVLQIRNIETCERIINKAAPVLIAGSKVQVKATTAVIWRTKAKNYD